MNSDLSFQNLMGSFPHTVFHKPITSSHSCVAEKIPITAFWLLAAKNITYRVARKTNK